MRQDALARRNEFGAPLASDYDALCAALSASARGRAFLDEHARRARQAETELALETLTRLEALLRQRNDEAEAKTRLRSELRALLAAVGSARTNFNRFEGMLAKRETVMALFDMLEQRVTEMLADAPAEIEPPANENELLVAALSAEPVTVTAEAVGWAERPVRRSAEREGGSEAHQGTVAEPVSEKAEERSSVRPRDLSAEALAKAESGGPGPQTSEPLALDPRLRGDERPKDAPQSTTAAAISQPEISTPSRGDPVPAQPNDIIARINALTPAERIALFS